ncbi:MAG: hypothetical protein M3Q39_14990 [Actinomycetota bacterium]|nr:hypothetical protein [Actinomycetota bacterium]
MNKSPEIDTAERNGKNGNGGAPPVGDSVPALTEPAPPQVPTADPSPEVEAPPADEPRVQTLVVLALVIVLVGAVAGWVGALVAPATYVARAQVLYPITQEQPTGFLREDRNLTTQLVFLRSRAVLVPAAAAAASPVDEFEKDVTISLVDSSEIIEVEVRDGSPEAALRAVSAIVSTYFAAEQSAPKSGVRDYLDGQLTDLRIQITDTRERLLELRGQPSEGAVTDAQVANADSELSALVGREQAVASQLDQLEIVELAGPTPELTTQPYALTKPISPKPLVLAATGALTGLVVAAGVVALVARRRTPA